VTSYAGQRDIEDRWTEDISQRPTHEITKEAISDRKEDVGPPGHSVEGCVVKLSHPPKVSIGDE
jgi:hypothetical protein